MDRLEEVKKILKKVRSIVPPVGELIYNKIASDICSLFEPDALPEYAQQEGYSMTATKLDESRLLSGIPDISISFSGDGLDYVFNDLQPDPDSERKLKDWVQLIRREQDAKTHAIDMEHEQARVEEARMAGIKEVGEWLEHTRNYPTRRDIESLKKGEMP